MRQTLTFQKNFFNDEVIYRIWFFLTVVDLLELKNGSETLPL